MVSENTHTSTIAVYNSFTGDTIGYVPQSTEKDVLDALDLAKIGEAIGRKMPASKRIAILKKAVTLMELECDVLSNLIATEGIKTIVQARKEVTRAINTMQLSAEEAGRIIGATIPFNTVPGSEDRFGYETKFPIGIVVAITPFNDPLNLVCHKLGPAIAAGNPVILKPSDYTPLVAIKFGEILFEAGLPKEMLSIITGAPEAFGDSLISDERVRLISFTGGLEAAKVIQRKAGLKKIVMELGSNSPVIVLSDADIEKAVANIADGIFFNTGQACDAGSRAYVHESIYENFLTALEAFTKDLPIAAGLDPDCFIGPMVSKEQLNTVMSYIEVGKSEGARLVCGGNRLDRPGYFIEPTVFADCKPDMKIVREEIFGPVLVVAPFSSSDEAVALANDTEYGLAAAIYSNDLSEVHRLIPKLKAGTVYVNQHATLDPTMPFGGYKQSGFGKDMGPEQLENFLETKSVWITLQ